MLTTHSQQGIEHKHMWAWWR